MALSAAASSQAASFNDPNASNAQTLPSYIDFDDNNCPGNGSDTGNATNGGLGLTLSGSATLRGPGSAQSCYMRMYWQGSASGLFGATATITPNFSMTIPSDVTITCSLAILINGNQVGQYSCTQTTPGTAFSLSPQTISMPANATTYSVQLTVNATWTDNQLTTFSINVPPDGSIDILAQNGAATAAVPALSPLALLLTALLLATLAGLGIVRGKHFPGQPFSR